MGQPLQQLILQIKPRGPRIKPSRDCRARPTRAAGSSEVVSKETLSADLVSTVPGVSLATECVDTALDMPLSEVGLAWRRLPEDYPSEVM